MSAQRTGMTLNKLRRYKLILELYNRYKTEDIPTAVVLRKYIYPVYPISRTTLYQILNTPVQKELREMEAERARQTSLF